MLNIRLKKMLCATVKVAKCPPTTQVALANNTSICMIMHRNMPSNKGNNTPLRERTGQNCVSVHHTFITEQLSQLQNWAQGLKIKIHCTT